MNSRFFALSLLAVFFLGTTVRTIRAEELHDKSTESGGKAAAEKRNSAEELPAILKTAKPQVVLTYGKAIFQRRDFRNAKKVFETLLTGDPQDKRVTKQQARLWLAKTCFASRDYKEAAEHLEQLKTSASDPASRYEAYYDLGACQFALSKYQESAGSFLKVATSAVPYGMNPLQQKALCNLKIITAAALPASGIAVLQDMTKNPDLKAFFINERMQRYLNDDDKVNLQKMMVSADSLIQHPALKPLSRMLLESIRKEGNAFTASKVQQRSIVILLPLSMTTYNNAPRPGIGNEVFAGMLYRAMEHQVQHPDIILDIHTGMTDPGDAEKTYETAKKTINDHKPLIIAGPLYSSDAVQASRAAKQAKTVLITPTATDTKISDNNDWCFQLNPTHEERGRITARELTGTKVPETVAVIAEKAPYLEEMGKGFLDVLIRAGVETYTFERFNGKAEEFKTVLESIRKAESTSGDTLSGGMDFDAVYIPMDSPDVIRTTLEQLRVNKIHYKQLLGSGIWNDSKTLNRFKTDLPEGITFFTDYYLNKNHASVRMLANNFRDTWNFDPGPSFWYGYDTFDYILHFLVEKGITDRKKLPDAIREASAFKGHYSQFHFSGSNINSYMNVLHYGSDRMTRIR
jgi:ABC-type branched-subunit amino acid transport system substrate-binding protein/tetratricopeptide (TPR) repeat protein